MRIAALVSLCLCLLYPPALAQTTQEEERGYLQALLEDNLSGAGRSVRIRGFAGALSSRATADEISIADDTGTWLTLRGVELDWTRSALLSGRVEVNQLIAEEILLPRLPQAEGGLTPEDTEAKPFSLPELPVSVNIGRIQAQRVVLGAPVLGEEAVLSVDGSLTLGSGEGEAVLEVIREGDIGALTLDASYANETQVLALDLALNEAEGGIAATLLGLPGRPALALTIAGEDPLSDYTASIALASDNQPRLTGTVTTALSGADEAQDRTFAADLAGDLAPLFAAEYRPFFGSRSALTARGSQSSNGAVTLEAFSLTAAALRLQGQLSLDAQGWPTEFDVSGRIGDDDGRIRLPVSGPATTLRSADLQAQFDASQGDAWQLRAGLDGFEQGPITVARANLTGQGTIRRTAPRGLAATLRFVLDGLGHADPALARALGAGQSGQITFDWAEDTPLRITDLSLQSGLASLTGSGELDSLAEGFPVTGTARLSAPDLARFGPLAGRDLAGQANLGLSGSGTLLSGAFDVEITGQTRDLVTATPRLDPLLKGQSDLAINLRRTTEGTLLDRLTLRNPVLTADASGQIDAEAGGLELQAGLSDVSLVEPKLAGAAQTDLALSWQAGGDVTLSRFTAQLADATITGSGTLSPEDPTLPAQGAVSATIPTLSRFAALAGRPLSGTLNLSLDGSGTLQGQDFSLRAEGRGRKLRLGQATADRLLAGALSFVADASRSGDQVTLREIRLETPQLNLLADGPDTPGAPLDVTARLANLALLAPGFNGPLRTRGTVRLNAADARRVSVNLNADGPGGTTARISGDINDYGQRLNLALAGNAPLALANQFIAPRSAQGVAAYDLSVRGAPALSSVSGRITTEGTRVSLPNLDKALDDVTGTINLANSQAQLDLSGQLRAGGQFRVRGPIGLTPGYDANLTIPLTALTVTDRVIFTTLVDGTVTVIGPLTGGARIGGALRLSETELQIPSGSAANSVDLPGLRHINAPAAVTATRARAGLVAKETGPPRRPFPLDLTIDAPNQIFVRGRGLNAELGGRLRLAGTTTNVVASGLFQLLRGQLDILGKRLDLTEGLIDLRGALDPYLRFVAETTAEDTVIQIIIEGLASAPEITFRSQPELPEEEVVARLLFGRGLDTISPFQAAQLASAVGTLAGGGSLDLIGNLRDATGLSDLDVVTTEDGNTEVSAGAYISDNIYSEVTADSEGRREINLNLDLTPNFTVKGGVDNEGGTGVGVFFEKDY